MAADKAKNETGGSAFARLRLSSIIAVSFLAVAALSLAYIGGVMVGRDSCPVPAPQVAREEETAARVPPKAEETSEEGQILTAEELEFARVLRGEKARPVKQPLPVKVPEPQAPVETAPEAPQPSPKAPEQPTALNKTAAIATGGMYDYVFQVGVFKDETGADNLRQRLEGYGLRTGMERGGKTFVVLIRLRGDEARAAEVIKIAEELKLGEPMLRSRKAAN